MSNEPSPTDPPPGSTPPPPPPAAESANPAAGGDWREKVQPALEASKTAAVKAAQLTREAAEKAWPVVQPMLRDGWLYLRIWAPALSNPEFRARQIIYNPRESRDGTQWTIEFPQQCAITDAKEPLQAKTFDLRFRSYEQPLEILGGACGLSLLFFLIWWFFGGWTFLGLWLLSLLGGAAALWLKSWNDRVHLVVYAQPDQLDKVQPPHVLVFDNNLYLIVDNPRLAEAARVDVLQKRRGQAKYGAPAGDGDPPPSHSAPDDGLRPPASPPPTTNYRRPELPPLKLDE